jgi:hypothetical protein
MPYNLHFFAFLSLALVKRASAINSFAAPKAAHPQRKNGFLSELLQLRHLAGITFWEA